MTAFAPIADVASRASFVHHLRMLISISYASRRDEVWRWYWQAWRHGLWRTHLSIFVAVATAASLMLFGGVPNHVLSIVIVGLIGLIPLIGFIIFPMLKFKPQTRTLTVDDRGIETTIGIINASVPWKDISEVRDDGEYLIIRRTNQNAFIVPPRAFGGAEDRLEFREFVSSMAKANGS